MLSQAHWWVITRERLILIILIVLILISLILIFQYISIHWYWSSVTCQRLIVSPVWIPPAATQSPYIWTNKNLQVYNLKVSEHHKVSLSPNKTGMITILDCALCRHGHAYHMVVMPKLNRSLVSCMASENFDLLEVGGLGGVKINIFFRFHLILQSEGLGLDWKPRAKMLPSCLRIILPKMIIYRCHRQHWFDPDSLHKLHLVLVQSKVTKSGCLDPMRKQLDLVFGTGPASSPLTMWLCIELLRVELVPFCFNEFCELVLVSYKSCVSCLQLHWYQSLHVLNQRLFQTVFSGRIN